MMKKTKFYPIIKRIFSRPEQHFAFESPFKGLMERPVYEILGIKLSDFPPVQCLSPGKLKRKFRRLIRILSKHHFHCELRPGLPMRDIYRYLTESFIVDKEVPNPKGSLCIISGCTGDCPACFQKEYCDIYFDSASMREEGPRILHNVLSSKKPS